MKFGFLFFILLSFACKADRYADFVDSGEFKALQRTALDVPNSAGLLKLSLGDISFGQVSAKLTTFDGQVVLNAAIREGESADFVLSGRSYRISLVEMKNYLIGADDATFRIRKSEAADGQTESLDKKVRILVESMGDLKGAKFWRNGTAYTQDQAIRHLLDKYESQRGKIRSLDEFIASVASESSVSGEPYKIILSDGTEILAGSWFQNKAKELRLFP